MLCSDSPDRGSQSLEFALISPLIAGAAALIMIAAAMANAGLVTYGLAQTLSRQISLNGTYEAPASYQVRVTPPKPVEGATFHVTVERPYPLPIPGKPTWTIRQQAWGVRAPQPES